MTVAIKVGVVVHVEVEEEDEGVGDADGAVVDVEELGYRNTSRIESCHVHCQTSSPWAGPDV